MDTRTYKSAATAGFNLLVQQYRKPRMFDGNFWFGGNTLHTCLDYLLAAGETDAAAQILPYAFDVYNDGKYKPYWWKDDYGWWGIAFTVAIANRSQLGYADPSYNRLFKDLLDAAQFCWLELNCYWRDKPDYSKETDYAAADTQIGGGVFNNIPGPDSNPQLCGRNSVTNESFWILSQRLAGLIPTNPAYAAGAKRASDWFARWLSQPAKLGIYDARGLVLERPTGSLADPTWCWTGDQGLFMAARNVREEAMKIAKSVLDNMAFGEASKKVLHENLDFTKHGLGTFEADYATGKGIFMRNLVRFTVNYPAAKEYADFIKTNASAVWCHRLKGDQFPYNWDLDPRFEQTPLRMEDKTSKPDDLCDLIMQAAGQDALNAAVYIAAEEQFQCPD